MLRVVLGVGVKRGVAFLAAATAMVLMAVGLTLGEPAAQTASPSGKIVYVGLDEETQQSDLYTMNPDGTGVSRLTDDQHEEGTPEWSPDGTQITFTSHRAGQDDIWAVDAPPTTPSSPFALLGLSLGTDVAWAASEPRNLTPGSGVEANSPDWGTAPSGGGTACTIKGTSGANTLNGTPGDDVICARDGDDTVYGDGGADVIRGGSGDDTLKGKRGTDRLIGNGGSDELFGGYGDDRVNSRDGTGGNDSLDGGPHRSGDKKITDATEKSVVDFP